MRILSVLALGLTLLAPSGLRAGEATPQVFALPSGAKPTRLATGLQGQPVWFASRSLGALGRLDPATGAVDLLSLGQGAKPASVAQAADGRLLAVDSAADIVHGLDPQSGDHLRHAIPSHLGFLELNAGVFDDEGRLWFTGYAGAYGRLDPATGQSAVFDAPGGRGPLALTRGADGVFWFASYTQSQILRLDPKTAQVEAIGLKTGYEGPKSLAVDASGRVWVAAYRSGSVLRFDPAARTWVAWRLPGRDPKPYALTIDADGKLWITDVGESTVLRFDGQSFAVMASTTPRGMARDILASGDDIFVAETGADQIVKLPAAVRSADAPAARLADRR